MHGSKDARKATTLADAVAASGRSAAGEEGAQFGCGLERREKHHGVIQQPAAQRYTCTTHRHIHARTHTLTHARVRLQGSPPCLQGTSARPVVGDTLKTQRLPPSFARPPMAEATMYGEVSVCDCTCVFQVGMCTSNACAQVTGAYCSFTIGSLGLPRNRKNTVFIL